MNQPTNSTAKMKRDITVGLAADGYKVTNLNMAADDFKLEYELM